MWAGVVAIVITETTEALMFWLKICTSKLFYKISQYSRANLVEGFLGAILV